MSAFEFIYRTYNAYERLWFLKLEKSMFVPAF